MLGAGDMSQGAREKLNPCMVFSFPCPMIHAPCPYYKEALK
jgi:hypothetical protein